jgi:ubiquinone/menaquinone biosynthesis C-methylase UbiE
MHEKEVRMSISDPSRTSVRFHEFVWLTLLKGYYRRLVESFGFEGGEKVLDFGSGPGAASRYIAPVLERGGGELTCLDISKTWIERAKKHLSKFSNVEFYAQDIRHWGEKEDYFDAVIIHFMLHDIDRSERQEVLRALASKMKASAKLFIREPTKESHGMSLRELQDLMSQSGFKQIEAKTTRSLIMGPLYTAFFKKE